MIRDGSAQILMKGKLETGALMKAVVHKENALSSGRRMSLIGLYECVAYPRLFTGEPVWKGFNT